MNKNDMIGSFIFRGIKSLLVFDRNTNDLVATIKYLTNVTLNDSREVQHLRGGYGMAKIIPILGERETVLEAENATNSMELMELMSSNKPEIKTANMHFEESIELKNGVATLKNEPNTKERIHVLKVDDVGKVVNELKLGEPDTNIDEYSIDGKEITVHEDLTGFIKVVYLSEKEVQELGLKTAEPTSYRMVGLAVCEDVNSRQIYTTEMQIFNAQIQPNNSYDFSNTSDIPEAVSLTIDILEDANHEAPVIFRFLADDDAEPEISTDTIG